MDPQPLLSADRLQSAVVASLAEGIAVVRPDDGTIVWTNAGAEAIFGYAPGELLARPVPGLFNGGAPSGSATVSAMASAVDAGSAWCGDLPGIRSDGAEVWCHLHLFPAGRAGRSADDEPGPVVVAISRVCAQASQALAEANTRLEAVNAELARSNADLSQFASVAAHDLKSPLQAVMGFGGLLGELDSVRADHQAREYAALLLEGAHRMHALVDDLLAYCRVGTATRQRGRVDCSVVLAEVLEDQEAEIARTEALVTSDGLPAVEGDGSLLYVVFSNLLSNALKFHAPGVAPRVHVGVERAEGEWLFSVADNGIGIDAPYRGRAFDIFRRLRGSEAYEGTGMGLAICKRAVERLDGRIWADANRGGGTLLCFTVPATDSRP